MKRVLGYVRISKADHARDESIGIEAQRAAIRAYVDAQGWEVAAWYSDDGVTGGHLRRPGITAALRELKARRADALVVAKLDRLSRSVLDLAGLLDTSRRQRWDLVVLNMQLDTSTATGKLMAHMLSAVAEFERDIISERTRAALAVRKEEGAQLGHPSTISADVAERIVAAHRAGLSFSAIARDLDADTVPTPTGAARWHHSVIAGVVRRSLTRAAVSA